jgi:hypothetical protein
MLRSLQRLIALVLLIGCRLGALTVRRLPEAQ